MQHVGVWVAVHLQHHIGKARVQSRHVAVPHLHAIGLHDAHELVVAHDHRLPAQMRVQVVQHASSLCVVARQVVNAQGRALGVAVGKLRTQAVALDQRGFAMLIGAVALVKHLLRHAVAIGIKAAARVGKGVPLRRVLRGQNRHVTAITSVVLGYMSARSIK